MHHRKEPLSRGILRETLRDKIFSHTPAEIFKTVLADLETEGKIAAEKDVVKIASHNLRLSPEEEISRERFENIYRRSSADIPCGKEWEDEAIRRTRFISD